MNGFLSLGRDVEPSFCLLAQINEIIEGEPLGPNQVAGPESGGKNCYTK